jgi:hypothetical protein
VRGYRRGRGLSLIVGVFEIVDITDDLQYMAIAERVCEVQQARREPTSTCDVLLGTVAGEPNDTTENRPFPLLSRGGNGRHHHE